MISVCRMAPRQIGIEGAANTRQYYLGAERIGAGRHHHLGNIGFICGQRRKQAHGRDIKRELASQGISLQAAGKRTVDEEISEAYKDVADVVRVVEGAGLAKLVARLRPFVVVKG